MYTLFPGCNALTHCLDHSTLWTWSLCALRNQDSHQLSGTCFVVVAWKGTRSISVSAEGKQGANPKALTVGQCCSKCSVIHILQNNCDFLTCPEVENRKAVGRSAVRLQKPTPSALCHTSHGLSCQTALVLLHWEGSGKQLFFFFLIEQLLPVKPMLTDKET